MAHCPPEVQRARLMGRDRLSRAQAEARIAAQAPLSEKIAVADYLVDTGGTMEQTREKALHVAAMLAEDQADLPDLRPRWRGGAAC